ncbi:hypothetical protein BpHYR1_015772 [Brachionus plicatilis]|uniref:Uncharacterized protein n=1 Tax=Brachionus plicatilis TaxID=10195 RepID=A0A3M7PBI2_BRAPC|nr:hypothetical protein BpHYR1_015772 [Brachionus plicatilis]
MNFRVSMHIINFKMPKCYTKIKKRYFLINFNSCFDQAKNYKTLNIVKIALSKHGNPVPCDLCGELMKNTKDSIHGNSDDFYDYARKKFKKAAYLSSIIPDKHLIQLINIYSI